MSEINASNFKKEHGDLAPDLVGVTELTSPYFFVPPSGTTAERPSDCEPGTLRFNTDHGSLEVFRGKTIGWEQIQRKESQYLGGGTGSNTGLGTRMVLMGGTNGSSVVDVIQFVTISTAGDAQDFGNLTGAKQEGAAATNHLRGLYFGGDPALNIIEFVTFSSLGNATDFGDLLNGAKSGTSMSNQTRGVLQLGGLTSNILEYVTFAQTANAVDFGDMQLGGNAGSGFSSPTRGVYAIGSNNANYKNNIEFITIHTTGNGTDFGDLSAALIHRNAYSNATRGVFHSGYQYPASPNFSNNIEFVTIATTGNTVDFGDSLLGGFGCGGSSPTRGVAGGGYFQNSPTGEVGGFTNIIDFIEIATTGNAVDFGDTTNVVRHIKGGSNGHGGL
tara:strand:- start:29 stop:1192 length:1164 start_codon:yes stop_codon:yes gene_type:complete